MFTFLVVLILITACLLILAVLVQNAKKEGLGSPLGDTGASQLIGVRKTSDLLEQLTWGLIVTLLGLTMATSLCLDTTAPVLRSPNIDRAQERSVLPTTTPQDSTTPQPDATEEKSE